MRTTILALTALILGTTTLTPATTLAAPVVESQRSANVFQGRIVGQNGDPIADALVTIVTDGTGEVVATARSDANGYYEIAIPADNCNASVSYSLRIRRIGYTPVTEPIVQDDNGFLTAITTVTMHELTLEL